jgi:hypothetical protein
MDCQIFNQDRRTSLNQVDEVNHPKFEVSRWNLENIVGTTSQGFLGFPEIILMDSK